MRSTKRVQREHGWMAFPGALWEGFTEGLTPGLGLCEEATWLGKELGQ